MKTDPFKLLQAQIGLEVTSRDGKRQLRFVQVKKYSAAELATALRSTQLALPESYVRFLTEVGACDLYVEHGLNAVGEQRIMRTISFFPVETLLEYNRSVSPDLVGNLSKFIVVGSDLSNHFFCFSLSRESENFGVFTPDVYAEEWHNEPEGWYDFGEWLRLLIEREGRVP